MFLLVAFTFFAQFLQKYAYFKGEIHTQLVPSVVAIGYPFGDFQN